MGLGTARGQAHWNLRINVHDMGSAVRVDRKAVKSQD